MTHLSESSLLSPEVPVIRKVETGEELSLVIELRYFTTGQRHALSIIKKVSMILHNFICLHFVTFHYREGEASSLRIEVVRLGSQPQGPMSVGG